jgi:exopolysaccharide production protein ExoQ
MQPRTHKKSFDLLLPVAWFISIFPVFFSFIWLSPRVIFTETILWLVVAALSVWYLIKRNQFDNFRGGLARLWFLLPFIIFSGLSILWSVDWQISLLRWLILLCIITTAGFIGLEYGLKEFVEKLAIFGILILLVCTLLVIFIPQIGVMNYYIIQGAWKGIFWHKNLMGFIASFFNVLFLMKLINSIQIRRRDLFFWAACFLGSLVILYQSDSVGAILTTIFLYGVIFLALLFMKFRTKLRKSHLLVLIAAITLVALILSVNLDTFFSIFNRDTSLTGRIPMWTYVFNTYVHKQPLIGYGFNAFWYIKSHRVAIQHAAGYPDQIVVADNGFIDLIVNTGYIGLALFLMFYLGAWWVSIKHAWKATDIIGFFPITLMIFSLVANISWSWLYENEGFLILVLLSLLFRISAPNLEPYEGEDPG